MQACAGPDEGIQHEGGVHRGHRMGIAWEMYRPVDDESTFSATTQPVGKNASAQSTMCTVM
jgi:hypothetical protein